MLLCQWFTFPPSPLLYSSADSSLSSCAIEIISTRRVRFLSFSRAFGSLLKLRGSCLRCSSPASNWLSRHKEAMSMESGDCQTLWKNPLGACYNADAWLSTQWFWAGLGWGWEPAFITGSQVILMPVSLGLHFERHYVVTDVLGGKLV